MSAGSVRRALVTGADGQVGRALRARVPAGWELVSCGSRTLDVTDRANVLATIGRERPAVVINAAAYTAVDRAESDPAAAEAVNAAGAAHVAEAADRAGARLLHLSTDYVFDGSQTRAYAPGDPPNPLGVYGRTKLAGEREVARIAGDRALILRTAWVYASHGRNFVSTMLRLMAERAEVRVVADQIGTPTWAGGLAEALWAGAARADVRGVHHWTDAGVASWFDFAVAIQEEALERGVLDRAVPIRPVGSEEHPGAAPRPACSVLDKRSTWSALAMTPPHWRVNLRRMMEEIARA